MYENAPATTLVATHCACCARPLVDAKSVETGMGPVCRAKHGYSLDVSDEARAAANLLVYRIAAQQDGPGVTADCNALRALGFAKLADRITARLATVRIDLDGESYVVRTPYSEEAVEAFRRVPGRQWDRAAKANRFPVTAKGALFATLCKLYPGATAAGPKGLFQLAA